MHVKAAACTNGDQLFLAKNTYVNGEIIAVDGGVLNMLAGR